MGWDELKWGGGGWSGTEWVGRKGRWVGRWVGGREECKNVVWKK